MIIVEGTDLVGKTTLCHKLTQHLGYTYQHLSRLPDTWRYPESYLEMMGPTVIQDRFHDSEYAYVYGRRETKTKLTAEAYSAIQHRLHYYGGIKILVTADEDSIIERYRQDEMYKIDVILRAQKWFMMNYTRFNHVITCGKGFPEIGDWIKTYEARRTQKIRD